MVRVSDRGLSFLDRVSGEWSEAHPGKSPGAVPVGCVQAAIEVSHTSASAMLLGFQNKTHTSWRPPAAPSTGCGSAEGGLLDFFCSQSSLFRPVLKNKEATFLGWWWDMAGGISVWDLVWKEGWVLGKTKSTFLYKAMVYFCTFWGHCHHWLFLQSCHHPKQTLCAQKQSHTRADSFNLWQPQFCYLSLWLCLFQMPYMTALIYYLFWYV